MVVDRAYVTNLLRVNGMTPDSPESDVRTLLANAGYGPGEVDAAIRILSAPVPEPVSPDLMTAPLPPSTLSGYDPRTPLERSVPTVRAYRHDAILPRWALSLVGAIALLLSYSLIALYGLASLDDFGAVRAAILGSYHAELLFVAYLAAIGAGLAAAAAFARLIGRIEGFFPWTASVLLAYALLWTGSSLARAAWFPDAAALTGSLFSSALVLGALLVPCAASMSLPRSMTRLSVSLGFGLMIAGLLALAHAVHAARAWVPRIPGVLD